MIPLTFDMATDDLLQHVAQPGQRINIVKASRLQQRSKNSPSFCPAVVAGVKIVAAPGKAAGLVLPWCNTATMTLHLAEITQAVAAGAHAVLLVDQAGWHMTPKLTVPPNISIIPLPAKSPELNPQENVWQFIRDNWLSNRIFTSYADIVDHCCYAWNKLVEEPWRIMSLGMRKWAHGS
jgi:hypothetical protein